MGVIWVAGLVTGCMGAIWQLGGWLGWLVSGCD